MDKFLEDLRQELAERGVTDLRGLIFATKVNDIARGMSLYIDGEYVEGTFITHLDQIGEEILAWERKYQISIDKIDLDGFICDIKNLKEAANNKNYRRKDNE